MKPASVAEFAVWAGGQAFGFAQDAAISSFALDSNAVHAGDLFLAFKGERVDGHDFAAQAVSAGAIGALVERPVDVPHILVPNVVDSLAQLAAHFRAKYEGPVIAITGSAGKTTTKEFVASALSPLGPILKTPGNRNSEYTVPLIWTEVTSEHRAVVVEMAMRGFNQIAHLASFSQPTVGLVTNIGFAHMEMVGSRHGIAVAKGELLEALPSYGTAVLWFEDEMLEWLRLWANCEVVTFGYEDGADCRITGYRATSWHSSVVQGTCNDQKWEANVPCAGRHIALNAAAAVLAAAVVGVDPQLAAEQVEKAVLPPMRMEVLERHGATVLLDNYNASPPSMIAAIETLAELPVKGRRLAVIGEMRELGEYTETAHRSVGVVLGEAGYDRVLFYGPSTIVTAEEAIRNGMSRTSISMASSIEDVEAFLDEMQPGDAVLVKGSRALELERAIHRQGHN